MELSLVPQQLYPKRKRVLLKVILIYFFRSRTLFIYLQKNQENMQLYDRTRFMQIVSKLYRYSLISLPLFRDKIKINKLSVL